MVSIVALVAGAAGALALVLAAAYLVNSYNSLVRLDNKCDKAKQNIDVKLKQRQDTLTKLIDTVREYMDHEEDVLTKLTEAREAADQAESPAEQAEADAKVREALAELNARSEAYPELRSGENTVQLQEEIARLEEEISDRREFYNDSVTLYNTRIQQIPHVVFANLLGYSERELFQASADDLEDVDISAAFGRNSGAATSGTTDSPGEPAGE